MYYGKVDLCGVNTAKLKTLTAEEKNELLKKARAGDTHARDELIDGNLRLVLSIVQRFSSRGESMDDLFQVGCIGLIKAVDNFNTDLDGCYFGGVRSCADMHSHGREYYGDKMGLDPAKTICSGNLIINSRLIRQDGMVEKFKALVPNKYHFQDQDVINIACRGKIKFLPPWYCLFTSFTKYTIDRRDELKEKYTEEEICDALDNGIVHYNGTKPWVAYCPNMDIWWEYYRKSIYFDHAYYFDFYFSKIDELDRMPFMKRLKLLVRYFTFGQTK